MIKTTKAVIAAILISSILVSCGDTWASSNNSKAVSSSDILVESKVNESRDESSEEVTTTTTTTAAPETTTTETTTPVPEPEPEEPPYSRIKDEVKIDGIKIVNGTISPSEFIKKGWTEQKDEHGYSSKYYKDGSSNYISFADGAIMDPDNYDNVVYGTVIVHINDKDNMFDVKLPGGLTFNSSYDEIIKALGTPYYDGDYTEDENLESSIKGNIDPNDPDVIHDEMMYSNTYVKYGRKNLSYHFDFEHSEKLPISINIILSEDNSRIEIFSVKTAQLGMK